MRHAIFAWDETAALALLARAPVLHLAGTRPDGLPVLRALDGALCDRAVVFHGALAGEKVACLGRSAVVSAEEVVAHLPSWFLAEDDASVASTFYRSVQVHGTLERVEDPAAKAHALEALMRKYQPEGRYRPIGPEDRAVSGVLVFRMPLERVTGKAKLGQNRAPEERLRILEGLWRRGAPGDVEALEAVRAAASDTPVPVFLAAPADSVLHAWLPPEAAEEARALLEPEYWWVDQPRDLLPVAHRCSPAWVGARDGRGKLVATARVFGDGKVAWLCDVAVAPAWRGRGLGQRLIALALDHPVVRSAAAVRLHTRDAQGLYARFGFVEAASRPRPFPATEMVLQRR